MELSGLRASFKSLSLYFLILDRAWNRQNKNTNLYSGARGSNFVKFEASLVCTVRSTQRDPISKQQQKLIVFQAGGMIPMPGIDINQGKGITSSRSAWATG